MSQTQLTGQALVVTAPGGEVALMDRHPLIAGPGELLVEPDLIGMCGTDLEIIDGTLDRVYLRYPLALGHEWTGIVAAGQPLAGRRVVVEAIIACGHCARCVAGQTNQPVRHLRRDRLHQGGLAAAGADRFETTAAAAGTGFDLALEAAGSTDAAADANAPPLARLAISQQWRYNGLDGLGAHSVG